MKNYWFILLILPLLSQAQSVGYDKLVLKFTPSSLLTPASPAWQFGVEYRPHKHFGINTDLATNLSGLRYLSFCGDCSGQKYYHTNFKWREEFRWYMPQRGIAEWFFAQEIFVTTDNFRLRNGYAKSDTLLYNFSKANHNVMGIGTASKFGVIYKLNSQVRLEIYAGLGIRLNHTSVLMDNVKLIGKVNEGDSGPTTYDRSRPTQSEIWPHISAGFRLGYALWK